MGILFKKRGYKRVLKRINLWIKNRKLTILFINKYKESLIDSLIKTYCLGKGVEVGVGETPYCKRKNTIYIDRYENNKIKADIVCDASDLALPGDRFDFLLSSHCLEHCPDALRVLNEWVRVIKPGGVLFLVLPHADRVIPDNERMKTVLKHHIEDYNNEVTQNDESHWEEIRKTHLIHKDTMNRNAVWAAAGDPWNLKRLAETSHLHYHAWTQNELIDILKYINLKIIYAAENVPERHDSFLVIARK